MDRDDIPQHTPGPWFGDGRDDSGELLVYSERGRDICFIPEDDVQDAANARLIAAAPDHAAIGWAMCVGSGRWQPWGDGRGEFCMNGLNHVTKLDEFGVPVVTSNIRAAIAKAQGSTHD